MFLTFFTFLCIHGAKAFVEYGFAGVPFALLPAVRERFLTVGLSTIAYGFISTLAAWFEGNTAVLPFKTAYFIAGVCLLLFTKFLYSKE